MRHHQTKRLWLRPYHPLAITVRPGYYHVTAPDMLHATTYTVAQFMKVYSVLLLLLFAFWHPLEGKSGEDDN